jgi:hypothetical protein
MRRAKRDDLLLRSYIREALLKEDQYSGGGDGGGGTGAGIGGSWTGADASSLSKTFLKPFTDVLATAAGKTKELARRGVTVLQVALETVGTTLLPFLTDSYDEIFKNEKKDLESIRSEYKSVYDSTNKALMNNDAIALAFFAYPGAVLTGKVAKEAPDTAIKLLGIATGGLSDKIFGNPSVGGSKSSEKKEGRIRGSRLLEEEKDLASVIADKKAVLDILKQSPDASSSAKKAQELHKRSLQKLTKQIETVMSASSIEDIEKIVGQSIKGSDKIKKEEEKNEDLAKDVLLSLKKRVKKMYSDKIKSRIEPVAKQFGENHPFVQDYLEVLKKLKQ